jgi:hypothetical protein
VRAPAATRAPSAFFDELLATWQSAASATGVESRSYRLAGTGLELEFAGSALVEPVTRALGHLPRGRHPDRPLTVHVWDSASTGLDMPRPPWDVEAYAEHGRVSDFCDDEFFTAVERWHRRSLVMVDLARARAIFWTENASDIPYYEIASPLKLVLHSWLRRRGAYFVHAGAVGREHRCALLGGGPGAGKSSAALACVTAGLRLLADDYCVLRPGRPPHVASLYSSAKTDSGLLRRLPSLEPLVSNPDRPPADKAVLFLHEHLPDRVLLEAELRTVLLPRIADGGRTRLRQTSPAAALKAIAPSTIFQLPGDGTETFRQLSEAVRAVPCYELELGADLADVARAVEHAVDGR